MDAIHTNSKNNIVYIFEYFVVFIVIFYAAKANLFVRALENWDDPIGLMLPILSIGALGYLKGVSFNYKYWLFLLGYTLYFIASTVKFGVLHPRFFGINLIFFTIAYVLVSGLRYRFFRIYEDLLYYLCIIALSCWTLQNLIPSVFIEILRNFEFSSQAEFSNVDFNTIVYTVSNYEISPDQIMHFGGVQVFRNPGFAWEPGAFATFINIAILFNLMQNKFNFKNNRHLWIFIIALMTTFSTTGYTLFILLVLFYIYNQNIIKIMLLVPLMVIVVMLLFTLPFMSSKILKNSNPTQSIDEMIYYSAKHNIQFGPQRFQSLQIDFIDFLNNPIIGYGGHQEARWTNQLGAHIASVSGIGKVMAQYGIVGLIFFLISLWMSSKQLIILFNIKGSIFPIIFILAISISYSIFTPLYMCIWLLYLSSFLKTEVLRRYTIEHILNEMNA